MFESIQKITKPIEQIDEKANMPRVSVILTSFNHGKYICEAIDSVLNQTFTDFELIILDDCSSDNSWDLINQYSDSRIKAFRNEVNKGPVEGLNNAILMLVKGEYISIHHSDDIWELNKLEKQVEFLESHSEIGAIFTNAQVIDERGAPLTNQTHFYYNVFSQTNRSRHEWLNYFFFSGNVLCHPSVLIRKSCYKDCGGYRIGLAQLPDFDMWVRLCAKYEIYVMPDRLIKFRILDAEMNTSGNRPDTRIRLAYELYKTLQLYRTIVANNDVFKIFPEFIKYDRGENTDPEYVLARVCLDSPPYFVRQILGAEILFDILNNPLQRQVIKQTYGFSLKDYVVITGQCDIFSREVLVEFEAVKVELHKQNMMLDSIRKSWSWRITRPLRYLATIVRNARKL